MRYKATDDSRNGQNNPTSTLLHPAIICLFCKTLLWYLFPFLESGLRYFLFLDPSMIRIYDKIKLSDPYEIIEPHVLRFVCDTVVPKE